jgi:(p)ppGpp synthase/HD superfamily hydrolase
MVGRAPFLTAKFDFALQFASALHREQRRKSTPIPYIAHLLSVCALVLEAGGDEDQAIVALLHDAVEDQGGIPTLETIRRLFGNRVADAVEACSDSTASDSAQKAPWRERKETHLAHLRSASEDALMVAAADKLHNVRTILAAHGGVGEQVWGSFNAPKADQAWYYDSVLQILLQSRLSPNPLVADLKSAVQELKRLAEYPKHA